MELNKIIPSELIGSNTRAVDSRILFAWLGLKPVNYSRDLKRSINNAGLIENVDYELLFQQDEQATTAGGAGKNRKDCVFTATAAKEVGMMSNKEKGKEIRKYFIQCEKVAIEAVKPKEVFIEMVETLEQSRNNLAREMLDVHNKTFNLIERVLSGEITSVSPSSPPQAVKKESAEIQPVLKVEEVDAFKIKRVKKKPFIVFDGFLSLTQCRILYEKAGFVNISRDQLFKKMIESGLAFKPNGKKTGYALLSKGEKYGKQGRASATRGADVKFTAEGFHQMIVFLKVI